MPKSNDKAGQSPKAAEQAPVDAARDDADLTNDEILLIGRTHFRDNANTTPETLQAYCDSVRSIITSYGLTRAPTQQPARASEAGETESELAADARIVHVDKQGVRFGKHLWLSHEKITGRNAEELNAGKGPGVKGYIEWLSSAPAQQAAPLTGDAKDVAIHALQAAKHFIANGVALGFIRMPDPDAPDPALLTPKLIDDALAALQSHSEREAR